MLAPASTRRDRAWWAEGDRVEVAGYLVIARRWWLIITAAAVLAAAGGYAVASQLPKVYEAEVRVLVGPLNTDLNTQRAAGQLAQTYAQLVSSQRVTEAVIRRVGVDMRPSALQEAMTAVPNDVTRLVTIRITGSDPELAAQLANAVAEELGILGAETARPEGQTQIIDPAEAPRSPSAPQVGLMVMLATFAGLLAAVACVILVEYFRDSLGSHEDLRELTDAPLLGEAPTRVGRRREFASAMLSSRIGDHYRMLTARIEPSFGGAATRTVLVVGVQLDGGAGVVAAGLALNFADRGIRTALIDANAQNPDATLALGLKPVPGLDRLVEGGQVPMARLNLVVTDTDSAAPPRYVELTVVPSGTGRDLGRVEHLEHTLERLAATSEVVVIAAPPVDRSSEALLWARLASAIVLVVPYPGARRREVVSSMEALRQAGLKLAGTIVSEPVPSAGLRGRRRGLTAREPAQSPVASSVARQILVPGEASPRRGRPETRTIGAAGDRDA